MDRRAVIISFGTNDIEARKTMENLENRLMSFSDIPVSTAHLLHNSGNTLDEIITEHGNEELLLMPLLIQKGSEYERICSYGFQTGEPLLGNEEDAMAIAEIMNTSLPAAPDTSYILIAHGTEKMEIKEFGLLQRHLRRDMLLTSLKGKDNYMTASFPDTKHIIIIPFLFAAGHHVKKDMRERVVPFYERKDRIVTLREEGLLSISDGFSELVCSHFRNLLTR